MFLKVRCKENQNAWLVPSVFSIFFEPIDGLQNKAERKNFYLAKSKDKEKVTSSVQKI